MIEFLKTYGGLSYVSDVISNMSLYNPESLPTIFKLQILIAFPRLILYYFLFCEKDATLQPIMIRKNVNSFH
jgi:hypothetical protein